MIFQQLQALSDSTRIRLLHILQHGEFSVGELTTILQSPQSTLSRHLKILLDQGWLQKRTQGPANWLHFEPAYIPASCQQLWTVVSQESTSMVADDLQRMNSVLALRKMDSQAFFRQVGNRWSELRKSLFGEHFLLPTLLRLLPSNLVVADLGCGNGDSLLDLAACVQHIFAVDQAAEMLAIAKERCDQQNLHNISFHQGTIQHLPIADQAVDAVLAMLVLHHIEDISLAFSEMSRILRPNGALVILDIVSHDRKLFLQTMGHKHLGFQQQQLQQYGASHQLQLESWFNLAKAESAMGPPLFVSTFVRKT